MITLDHIAALYIALFSRAPEGEGLYYWYNEALRYNWSLSEVAENMFLAVQDLAKSNPLFALYYIQYIDVDQSDYNSVRSIVETIYINVFGKDYNADPEGIDYWVNEVLSGKLTLGNVAANIIYTALNTDWSNDPEAYKAYLTFLNRIEAAIYVANNIETFEGTFEDFEKFRNFILQVTDDPTSLESLKELIENSITENPPVETLCAVSNDIYNYKINLTPEQEEIVKALIWNYYKWNVDPITYSFPEEMPPEYLEEIATINEYFTSIEHFKETWEPFTEEEKNIAREIILETDKIIDPSFVEVPDQEGLIRFSNIEIDTGVNYSGFARLPSCDMQSGGDVFIDKSISTDIDYLYMAITHELGHALNLKHPFEEGYILPEDKNNRLYTIMSYTDYKDYVIEIEKISSISFSYTYKYGVKYIGFRPYDILALQALYGIDNEKTKGDDIYYLSNLYEDKVYITIWDSGGIDTIDVSNTKEGSIINLEEGSFSSIDYHPLNVLQEELYSELINIGISSSMAKEWSYKLVNNSEFSDKLYTGENNLAIAFGTIIENVITGIGNDIVKDNDWNNEIVTNDGDDKIYISGGNDFVDGGAGYDIVFINDVSSNYNWKKTESGYILENEITGEIDTLLNIEEIYFDDQSIIL